MTTSVFIILAAVLLLLCALCLFFLAQLTPETRTAGAKQESLTLRSKERLIQRGQWLLGKSKRSKRNWLGDIVIYMRKAGYVNSREQTICFFKIALAVSLIQLIVSSTILFGDIEVNEKVGVMLSAGLLSVLLAIRWLKNKAEKRTRIIDEEMLLAVHLMRVLWEVGLSIESLLKAYYREASTLTPELCKEIQLISGKIDSGQSRESALSDVADRTDSEAFYDLLTMLMQVGETGGGLSTAFHNLARLLQERRRTGLQEKVTRMSGKMSVVMMVFMFPALFIVLGGPAVMALMSALGG